MKITIFGAGYVGLSTAVCLATKHDVSLVDIDADKINAIDNGQPLIYEEGLDDLLEEGLTTGRLKVFHLHGTIPSANIIFITVGTPSDPDGYINLTFVRDIAKTLQQRKTELFHPEYSLVVIRSTVIPGTTTRMLKNLEEANKVGIAFSPEFLAQGSAISNTFHPNRLIIGANDSHAASYLEKFYRNFYAEVNPPILKMSIESAEFAKYAANALLATKISFANELANIVESFPDANIDDIMKSVGLDPRISPQFLQAGIGFGGSCFPKDLRALVQFAQDLQAEKPVLLNAVLQVNENRPLRIIKLLRKKLGDLTGRQIAVLGLAFKPGTNDTRETPALSVIRSLWRNGAIVSVHDPLLARIEIRPFNRYHVQTCPSIRSCVTGADACIVLTEWPEYLSLDLPELTREMRTKLIIDGRRIFSQRPIPNDVTYLTIGNHTNHSEPSQETHLDTPKTQVRDQ